VWIDSESERTVNQILKEKKNQIQNSYELLKSLIKSACKIFLKRDKEQILTLL
jgi:hypothetical protein